MEVDRLVGNRKDASSNDNGADKVLANELPSSLCLLSRFCLRHFARRFLNQTWMEKEKFRIPKKKSDYREMNVTTT